MATVRFLYSCACRQLEQEGFDVTYLVPDASGIIEPRQVEQAIRHDTTLVSLMHVNNQKI